MSFMPGIASPMAGKMKFMDFIAKYKVMGLAVGFIMGLYVNKLVSALVDDIIMPIPGAFIPGGDWRKAIVTVPMGYGMNLAVGDFVGVMVDSAIVAIVVFLKAKYARRIGLT